jgi:sporulation protein YlmC with PRC-barrel domain
MDSAQGGDVIRVSSLLGKKVVAADGRKLGRVEEIHVDERGTVTMLDLGARGWLEREGANERPKRITWDKVEELGPKQIVLRETGRH